MKLLILGLILAGSAQADVFFSNQDSHGLKKLNVHSDLEIECTMAINELKDRLRKSGKSFVANPCISADHTVDGGHGVKLSKKVLSSVLILN